MMILIVMVMMILIVMVMKILIVMVMMILMGICWLSVQQITIIRSALHQYTIGDHMCHIKWWRGFFLRLKKNIH